MSHAPNPGYGRAKAFRSGGGGGSAVALFVVLTLLAPGAALGKLCGDDVKGHDVACACGDIVASDLVLGDDPVTQGSCPRDGLIVRAPAAGRPLTVDLAGRTLRGSGNGVGLWLIDGGPGGAKVVSSGGKAIIEGFRDGIVGRGARSLAVVEDVSVRGNSRDGIRVVDVEGARLRSAEALDSGRDGFSVAGNALRITNTRSVRSSRFGYNVSGERGEIGASGAGNVAEESGHTGFVLSGTHHRLVQCVAKRSKRDGVKIRGVHQHVSECRADHNGESGIVGEGSHWTLAGNRALENGQDGIRVAGARIVDDGGNAGARNHRAGVARRAAQCEINRRPCRP